MRSDSPAREQIFTNAHIVLGRHEIHGAVVVVDGRIEEIVETQPATASHEVIDFGGDYLIPGLVELHTDNVERHAAPRPGVHWPCLPAVMAHDAQVTASGITTVFDALRIGDALGEEDVAEQLDSIATSIETAQGKGLLRADHLLHLRCEITCENVAETFETYAEHPLLRLVSVMDHAPGQRQFVDISKYREYFQGKYGFSEAELDRLVARHQDLQKCHGPDNRRRIVEICRTHGIAMASHDDATAEHVAESSDDGMAIAEFPTTIDAARASHENGLKVLMGAPNLVRGSSHSGNISARALIDDGVLDILSSDYVPGSLVQAAFLLPRLVSEVSLPESVAKVSSAPAQAAGLSDRGEIATGKRADLVRVRADQEGATVLSVWRQGHRVV